MAPSHDADRTGGCGGAARLRQNTAPRDSGRATVCPENTLYPAHCARVAGRVHRNRMPVRKKGNRWEVRVSDAGGRTEDRLPVGAKRQDALDHEARIRKELVDQRLGRRSPTVGEVLDDLETEACALKSWERDLRYRYATVRGAYGERKISEAASIADAIRAASVAAGKAPATANRLIAVISRAAKKAGIQDPIIRRTGEKRRTERADLRQLGVLLSEADERLRPMIQFAVHSGMRKGEMFAMTPDSIRDGHAVLPDTKPGRARIVPLSPDALRIARKHLPWSLGYSNARKLYDEARAKAGLSWLRWHDLRRTFGSLIMKQGATLVEVRDLLGHSDIRTTSIYLASERADLSAAVSRMPTIRMGKGRGRKSEGSAK